MKTWIMVANSSIGQLYGIESLHNNDIVLLKEYFHPQSRQKGLDILTDKPGHFSTDHKARGTYEKADPKEIESDAFSRELANVINLGHNNHKFEKLILVTAPHFYGLINKHLALNFEAVHIPKDYTKLKPHDLLISLRTYLNK